MRPSTPNHNCLIELGLPTLHEFVRFRQFNFYNNYVISRINICQDPLYHVFNIVNANEPSLTNYFIPDQCPIITTLEDIKQGLPSSDRSKSQLYLSLNPSLETHQIYLSKCIIKEYERINFTRLRLSSHRLKSETGRWHVPPLPRNERICTCGNTYQDEQHIIENCPLSSHIRSRYPGIHFNAQHMLNHLNPNIACPILYEIYNLYI